MAAACAMGALALHVWMHAGGARDAGRVDDEDADPLFQPLAGHAAGADA